MGLLLEGIVLIMGVDCLLDMICIVVNIIGDVCVFCIVVKFENVFDEVCFVDLKVGEKEEMVYLF